MLSRLAVCSLLLAACASPEPVGEEDVCELAAAHTAACTGDYVTPPICDEAGARQARDVLDLDCESIGLLSRDSKADGAFCDWFGIGCTPDERIFTGPACSRDADCAGGSACVENHCFAGVSSPEFAAIMDKWTQSRETAGSATHLLVGNDETRKLRNQLMAGAQRSIHFIALMILDDETGWETVELLAAAARRGVTVRVVVDATTQYFILAYPLLERLRDAGVQVLPFNPLLEWAVVRLSIGVNANQRLHEKILVVDGARAIVGGRNVGDDYLLSGKWRDTCVDLTGPGVADVERMFLSIWAQLGGWERQAGCPQQKTYGFACPAPVDGEAPPVLAAVGPARTRPIYSDPRTQPTPLGYRAMLNLVRGARRTIYITNAYFVPPRRLRKHLKAAAARGVRVVVLTNSVASTDGPFIYYAGLNYYKELIGAGIEIREHRGSEMLHAKTMIVDGEVALVGSFNIDPRSAVTNSEAMVLVRDGEAVAELSRAFAVDTAYADVASAVISAADWLKAKANRLIEPLI